MESSSIVLVIFAVGFPVGIVVGWTLTEMLERRAEKARRKREG